MDLVHPDIDHYLRALPRRFHDTVLDEMESLAADRGFPIVGPLVGELLYTVALSLGARRVLELGSGFGYSAYFFARAVGPTGQVISTELDEDNAKLGRSLLSQAGLGERVSFLVGEALGQAESLTGQFDIVFNDIDKENYPAVLPLARRLVRPGGMLVCDNMLWSGRVAREGKDEATEGIRTLTRRLYETPDFTTTLIPLRDGVTLSLKSHEGSEEDGNRGHGQDSRRPPGEGAGSLGQGEQGTST